jgi:hypothetical protein
MAGNWLGSIVIGLRISSIHNQISAQVAGLKIGFRIERVNNPDLVSGTTDCDIESFLVSVTGRTGRQMSDLPLAL